MAPTESVPDPIFSVQTDCCSTMELAFMKKFWTLRFSVGTLSVKQLVSFGNVLVPPAARILSQV